MKPSSAGGIAASDVGLEVGSVDVAGAEAAPKDARAKWRLVAEKVAPSGLTVGLEAAAALAAANKIKRALSKPPGSRDAADLRCAGGRVSHSL